MLTQIAACVPPGVAGLLASATPWLYQRDEDIASTSNEHFKEVSDAVTGKYPDIFFLKPGHNNENISDDRQIGLLLLRGDYKGAELLALRQLKPGVANELSVARANFALARVEIFRGRYENSRLYATVALESFKHLLPATSDELRAGRALLARIYAAIGDTSAASLIYDQIEAKSDRIFLEIISFRNNAGMHISTDAVSILQNMTRGKRITLLSLDAHALLNAISINRNNHRQRAAKKSFREFVKNTNDLLQRVTNRHRREASSIDDLATESARCSGSAAVGKQYSSSKTQLRTRAEASIHAQWRWRALHWMSLSKD